MKATARWRVVARHLAVAAIRGKAFPFQVGKNCSFLAKNGDFAGGVTFRAHPVRRSFA